MIGKSRFLAIVATCIVLALAMSACETKSINDIRAEPSRYADRDVSVAGTVVRSFSVIGRGVYEIEDGTGKLWVVSDAGVPREGAKVLVKGRIVDAFDLTSMIKLPEPLGAGLVMKEKSHKAR